MAVTEQLDLDRVRERLQQQTGKRYWRTLEELVDSAGFQEALRKRLPRQAEWINATLDLPSRRTFLKLMGASLAMAGLSGCVPKRRVERIMPYVAGQEAIIPGKPLFFATATTLGGYAKGVLVESHEGRPTKIEGNPDHPASLGATDALTQAHIWDLYDPERSQTVLRLGQVSTWGNFLQELNGILANKNLRLRLLTETVTSPTLADQIGVLLARFPAAQWHQYEPVNQDNALVGAQLAFGEVVNTVYHFDKADVILSLDADFLLTMPGSVRYARDFIDKRRVSSGQTTMNRLYVIESAPTITGAMADHRLALRAGEVEQVARAVATALGVQDVAAAQPPASLPDVWLSALVKDLQAHAGAALIVAGAEQPPLVHALAHAMNVALKNVGATVVYTAPVAAKPVNQGESLRQLVEALQKKEVDLLVILGGNPVYNAPVDLGFAAAMEQAPTRIHLGPYYDETAIRCHWHLPETHILEMWGDARAYDGTISLIQPLIEPLYDGRSIYEVLAALNQQPDQGGLAILRAFWQQHSQGDNFENAWQTALEAGVIAGSALPAKAVTLQANFAAQQPTQPTAATGTETLELIFRPDPSVWDGCFANNAWLQELPKPLSKLTWDNAALLSPTTAARLTLDNGDLVELHYRERAVTAPVLILPGQPDNAVTVHLGYGRTQAGHIGTGVGFNAYLLRTADAPWFGTGLTLRKVGSGYDLAQPHTNYSMEGRDLVMAATLQEYQANPTFALTEQTKTPEISLYPAYEYTGYAWGMSIDLTACIGCNACVVACQAENNIPVVGKEEVLRGHEMHWLRVDRYYTGPAEDPDEIHFQPVPCMQCENAPCELVCPVMATAHSDEGLNDMVYNRCVGTRYCSNNCPYKVRRFNFLQYADWETESLKLGRNPDVSVRVRGVMEKCTYCVQRITEARIAAEEAGRRIGDGEIQTACQQACPTRAIIFGDINDRNAAVTQLKASPLNYALLANLNTRPRTTYLADVRNPNPELGG
ncbi:MAG: 4Fe-4S dicluster domain-containing protein [Caldilinea sp. CFX5]|nr:4Fe-4S dicluster domain-containing protein [Caldilinea sp. CFX5]